MKTKGMKKLSKVLAVFMTVFMLMGMMPQAAFADEVMADDNIVQQEQPEPVSGTVYISISDDAKYTTNSNGAPMANIAVGLEELQSVDLDEYGLSDYVYDADSDGNNEITALHLYIYTHEELLGLDWSDVYVSGSAGSIYFAGGLFGFSDENLRYDYNGAYPAVDGWGLTADRIVLKDGDFLNIAHYTSWAFWSDSATGFHYFRDAEGNIQRNYTADDEGKCSFELVRSFSDWNNGGASAYAAEPGIEVYYGTSYGNITGSVTTNDDGIAEIKFPSSGTWYVWADGLYGMENPSDIVSAPAFATVTVTENEDLVYADAVITLIKAIGTVDVHSGSKVNDAREAYDALTDSQKALVTNYERLTAAEKELGDLYEAAAKTDHKAIYETTGKYIAGLGTPSVGSTGGEWMVIDITRAGGRCPEGYYDNVVEYVKGKINDKEQLHRAKSTDNSRVILGLTSAGYDVTDVAGHNLLKGLTDMSYVKKQGINGPIWALIAFDSHDYDIPKGGDVTRDALIETILAAQHNDGGWSLSAAVDKPSDPDMTGMALQALAPYYDSNDEVKAVVDEALVCISEMQLDNGGFGSVDGACSESCAQVIVALTALGINPETDSRFVKNGMSAIDAMCLFAVDGGGFAHVPNGTLNGMATEQSQYALAAYYRMLDGKTSLYDMTDVKIGKSGEWKKSGSKWWYKFSDGTYPKSCWETIDGKDYYFDKSGYMVTSKWVGDYYVGKSGAKAKNQWVGAYYVGDDGKYVKNQWAGNYYCGANGKYQKGWLKLDEGWYYLGINGKVNKGWFQVKKVWYYGDKATGLLYEKEWLDNKYYFKSGGAMATGWLKIEGDYYYFNKSGAKATSKWVGNYYLKADGKMATDEWIGNYYVDANGKWVKGAKK